MSYANEGIDQRAEVKSGTTDSVVYYVKQNGAVVEVDATTGYATIHASLGGELVSRAACVVAAGGRLSLSQAWPLATYPLAEDYRVAWEWQVAGATFTDDQYFDVVKSKLPCLIDTSDLQELYPDIVSHMGAIGETDCSKGIKRGWAHLMARIRSGRNRPSLILDRHRLISPAIHIAMHYVADSLKRVPDDLWDERMKDHFKKYEAAFAQIGELKYDINEDAIAQEGETKRINRKRWQV